MSISNNHEPVCRVKAGTHAGFTLVEVSLAILVLGLGLLAVFSLFPSGLRMADDGSADTKCGMFAETTLNGLQGNAGTITNWGRWSDGATFIADVLAGLSLTPGVTNTVSFPADSDPTDGTKKIRYVLSFGTNTATRYSASLMVWPGEYGPLSGGSLFYTEFVYSGF